MKEVTYVGETRLMRDAETERVIIAIPRDVAQMCGIEKSDEVKLKVY